MEKRYYELFYKIVIINGMENIN